MDILPAALLAIAGFVFTLFLYERLSPSILHYSTWDFWFESDPARTVAQSQNRLSPHHHSTSHHPLVSLLVYPPVFALRTVFQMSAESALGVYLACVNAIALVGVNFILRMLGLLRLDAFVFTALLGTSASAVFWFGVPETFWLGAVSILCVLAVAAWSDRMGRAPDWVFIAASAAAMSVTTTNWLAGLAMLVVYFRLRPAIEKGAISLILVMAAFTVEASLFPEADSFLKLFRRSEVDYLFNPESLGIVQKLIAFFSHSIVIPELSIPFGYRLSVQGAAPGAGGLSNIVCAIAWIALLAVGVWAGAQRIFGKAEFKGRKTLIVMGCALAGQVLITLMFGIESFLYAAHFAPLLVCVAALGALTRARMIVVPAAAVLAVALGFNNLRGFEEAAARLVERDVHERAFTEIVRQNTDADALFVCGAGSLRGSGESALPWTNQRLASVIRVTSETDPETCVHSDVGEYVELRGWRLRYRAWTLESLAILEARGARYFVTQYEYGIAEKPEFFDALDARYVRLSRTPRWAIYDLQQPNAVEE
jgi:hypothetical protein